ncbi:MAG TPA: hypothetical protein VKT49_18945 [Bryobacteraceae bacterium]|nr:hypothetical protein [Bryobacteraceae bacterium]
MPDPSLRYITARFHGDIPFSRTEYILGRNSRSEYRDATGYCDGDPNAPGAIQYRYGPQRALIHNRDLHHTFHLDLEAGVYTMYPLVEFEMPRVHKRARPAPRRSGPTLRVHTQTTDTGERREIFGYPARRVIARVTKTLEGTTNPDETEVDGWYINPPAAWLLLHPPRHHHAILLSSRDGKFPTPVFTDEGPPENGFPLILVRTHRSSLPDAAGNIRSYTNVSREEVTEISEEPLDHDLFTPPRHFRRVKRLPGERPVPWRVRLRSRLRLRWLNLQLRLPI